MANKNKHVIIGYFPSKEAATEAANQLKQWDKANDDVKLGGMGILTWENGKIKSRKVGNRAGGTGAKWGLILGAATGILSGGVTLIGGAAVGVVGGAVAGSLFHKHLGLTDADKDRLVQYLQNGGAAVVVMADDHEVEPAKAELASLGAKVENYEVPEETVEQVEEAVEVEQVEGDPADHVDERVDRRRRGHPGVRSAEGARADRPGHRPGACRGPGGHRDHHPAGAAGSGRDAGGPSRDRRAKPDQRKAHRRLGERRRSHAGHGRWPAERRAARGGRCGHGGRSGPAGRSQPARETGRRQRRAASW